LPMLFGQRSILYTLISLRAELWLASSTTHYFHSTVTSPMFPSRSSVLLRVHYVGDDIPSRHYLNLSLLNLQQDTLIHFTAMHRFRGCQLFILSHMHFIVPNSILL
jgi:hypothetical protein